MRRPVLCLACATSVLCLSPGRASEWRIVQLTDNAYIDSLPSVYDGTIAWQCSGPMGVWDVFYWDGANVTQITDDDEDDGSVSLWAGRMVWAGQTPTGTEVYLWERGLTTQLTDNTVNDLAPSVSADLIAWSEVGDATQRILTWDGR